ncbi:MAG: MucR family transcriptional regulator [Deltaproteobacteria bacterium]|nr:MucR family transcriptional regulator [Deltaproteobacteria bacterium]
MSKLLELAAEIVIAHVSQTSVNKEELLAEIGEVHNVLAKLYKGEESEGVTESGETLASGAEAAPAISVKKAFKKDKVACMICGKEMKTLARHLKSAHEMTPKEYRQKFDIPKNQPLAAKNYSESRRQMAISRGLGDNLAKARAKKAKSKQS